MIIMICNICNVNLYEICISYLYKYTNYRKFTICNELIMIMIIRCLNQLLVLS